MPVKAIIALSDQVDTTKIVHERIFAAVYETIALKLVGIDNFTTLLLHMTGADGSTTFTDASLSAQGNATVVGTAQVDTDQLDPWGTNTGVLLLDGNSDYIYYEMFDGVRFGTGEFVLDTWVRSTDTINNQVMHGQFTGLANTMGVTFGIQANRLHMFIGGGASSFNIDYAAPTGDVCDGNWNHVALIRSGNNFMLFLNGVQVGVSQVYAGSTDAIDDSTNKTTIGVLRHVSPSRFFNGSISEFRTSKGTDRGWSGGFTPPTAPYTMYPTDSPSPAAIWTALGITGTLNFSTLRIPENLNTGDAGTVKYQYALNSGALNGTWLTQAQLQAIGNAVVITDITESVKIVGQYISDGSQKTTSRSFAEIEYTPAAGGSQADITDVRFGVVYNDGALTGTAHITTAPDTREGVLVDDTVGTLAIAGPDNVRLNIPTDDTVGNYVPADEDKYAQNQQYGSNGTEFTGTKTVTQFQTDVDVIQEENEILIFEGDS